MSSRLVVGCALSMLALWTSIPARASSLPKWFTPFVEDSSCRAEPGFAPARVLYETVSVRPKGPMHVSTTVRRAIRVNRPEGKWAAFIAERISPERKIQDLKGWRVGASGASEELRRDTEIQVSDSGQSGIYHDSSLFRSGFFDAKPGDVIGFEYTIEDRELSSQQVRHRFERSIPTCVASLRVETGNDWSVQWSGRPPLGVAYSEEAGVHRWEGTDLPARAEESLASPCQTSSDHLVAYLLKNDDDAAIHTRNWEGAADWARSVVLGGRDDSPDLRALADRLTSDALTREDRLRAITRYVSRDVRYVAVELGRGGWYPREPAGTIQRGFGDCKDKTVLARALLEAVGVDSHPVLVAFKVEVDSTVASPFQFDHCILGIPDDSLRIEPSSASSRGVLYWDPTASDVPIGSLPISLSGRSALPLSAKSDRLCTLPLADPDANRVDREFRLVVGPDGFVRGTARIRETGGLAASRNAILAARGSSQWTDEWDDSLRRVATGVEIRNPAFELEVDSCLVTFDFTGRLQAASASAFLVLEPFRFLAELDSVPDFTARRGAVWLGPARVRNTRVEWVLPENWRFELLREESSVICTAAEMTWRLDANSEALNWTSRERYLGIEIPRSEFVDAESFIRRVRPLYERKTVLRNQ